MKYGVVGYSGRMGHEIISVFDNEGHEGVLFVDEHGVQGDGAPEVIINFALPSSVENTVELCEKYNASLVIGATGLTREHFSMLKKLSLKVPVVQSYNFATGVNILKIILREFGDMMAGWDAEVVEIHHNKKKDAPSGTAILLRDALLDSDPSRKTCETHSLRVGGVPGDHEVVFANDGEVLTFSHRAISRKVFALGALRAARFAVSACALVEPKLCTYQEIVQWGK